MTTYTAEQITRIGGNEWQKNDKHRIYLNDWATLIGLETESYKSGNIRSATLNGAEISNTKARRILGEVSSVYLDLADGKVHIWHRGGSDAEEIAATIRTAIAAQVAATEPRQDDTDDQDGDATPNAAAQVGALRQTGRTVREIAQMVGVAVSTIYRWARGACRPRPTNAAALAALI